MFSPWQVGIVILIALVVFGPKRLPEIGKALGRGVKEFKDNVTEDNTKQQMTNITEQPKELPPKSDSKQ